LHSIETIKAADHDFSTELGDNDLTAANEEPEHNEDPVLVHSLEDVPFVMNLARAQHVEDLQENKGGENKCQMA